jgi:hypothetical protein
MSNQVTKAPAWVSPTGKIERIMDLQFKELKTRLKELEQKVRQQDMQLDYLMKEVYGVEAEVDDDERISCE